MLKYFTLYGTTQRTEYWLTSIAIMVCMSIMIMTVMSVEALLAPVGFLIGAAVWVGAAVTVKRVRDTGCSGWFFLLYSILALVPYIGFVAQVVWMCLPTNFFDRFKQK